jgi:hypothetical protein
MLKPFMSCFHLQARKRDEIILQKVTSQLVEQRDQLKPADVVSAVYALCKFHFNADSGRSLGILTAHVRRNLESYSLTDISQIVASLARVGVYNRPLLTAIIGQIHIESLRELSNQSLSNLMTGLARFGVTSSPKNPIWTNFAAEVSHRLSVHSEWTNSDLIACVVAYSSASRANHDEIVTNRLFSAVSRAIISESIDMPCVLKYIKACSRVQFRHVESLAVFAKVLRGTAEFPAQIETQQLLQLYSNLDKLGIDMTDVEEELRGRNIHIPESSKFKTWFTKSTNTKQTKSPLSSDSLRKRKYSW